MDLRRVGRELAATAIAATLSGAPSTVHSVVTRRPVLATVRAAATLVRPSAADPGARLTAADLVAGGIAHGAVSMFWGSVLARTLPRGRRAAWGAVGGIVIHAIDLGVVARLAPRLAPMTGLPQLPQLGDHIAFGFTFGLVLDHLDRADPEPARTRSGDQATSSSAAG